MVLVSPRLRRSNASLERLLDGSWYAAAPTSSREALLMPQCRLRSARRGCTEGALHGLEDSSYPARMRKAPPTSQGGQSPGRRIAGGKGIPEHVVDLILTAAGRLRRRRQPGVSFRHPVCARRAASRAPCSALPIHHRPIRHGLQRKQPPCRHHRGRDRPRSPARPRPERRLPESGGDRRCRHVGGCRDVGRLRGSSGAHRDGPADGRNGRVSGDRRHPRQDRVPSREGRRQRIRRATRRAVGTRADRSAERIRHAPAVKTRSAVSGPAGHSSRSTWQMPTSR